MKKFLAVFTLLLMTLNFIKISVARAETKTYTAREAAILDFAEEKAEYVEKLKTAAKERATERIKERAGFFVRSVSRLMNGVLTDDIISAYTSDKIKVLDVQYKRLFFQAQDTNNNDTGKVGYMYEATVTAEIDTAGLNDYLQKSLQEKQNLKPVEQKISQPSASMIFSQPVTVGEIGTGARSPYEGFYISDATEIQATPAKDRGRYTKGWARFGEGAETVYCHFGDNGHNFNFGGKNISNSVKAGEMYVYVKKINNTKNQIIYLVETRWGSGFWGNFGYDVIGQMDNGKWVKYFSASGSRNPSTGNPEGVPPHPSDIIIKDDTIIIEFSSNVDSKKVYEMRYKWDDKAQWFSVEKVTY